MTDFYDGIERRLGGVLRGVCAVLLAALLVIPALNIANRWMKLFPMAWYEEVITLCFSWMIFLAAAELWRTREMFTVDFFTHLIGNVRLRSLLRLIVSMFCLALFAVLLVFGVRWIGGIRSTTAALRLPTGLLYASIPVSTTLMLVMTVRDIAGDIVMLRKGEAMSLNDTDTTKKEKTT